MAEAWHGGHAVVQQVLEDPLDAQLGNVRGVSQVVKEASTTPGRCSRVHDRFLGMRRRRPSARPGGVPRAAAHRTTGSC